MDLSKLSPAPWEALKYPGELAFAIFGPPDDNTEDLPTVGIPGVNNQEGWAFCEFSALARNAFDVLMRRKWSLTACERGWIVIGKELEEPIAKGLLTFPVSPTSRTHR